MNFRDTVFYTLACAISVSEPIAKGDDPPAPKSALVTTAPASTSEEIRSKLKAAYADCQNGGYSPSFSEFTSSDFREKSVKLIPPLLRIAECYEQLSAIDEGPSSMSIPGGAKVEKQVQWIASLSEAAALGDKDAVARLSSLAAARNEEIAVAGKIGNCLVAYLIANNDHRTVSTVLDRIRQLAMQNSSSEILAGVLRHVRSTQHLPLEVSSCLDELFTNTLTGAVADGMKASLDAGNTTKNALGKPILIEGSTIAGERFSSKALGGKVLIVDFWATWCGPCRAQLPYLKELYTKYHETGLEIIGVSCDSNSKQVAEFTSMNRMPWVQLWDKSQEGVEEAMHPLVKRWKLDGIPQLFLIDRHGVLRSTSKKEIDKLLLDLLAEKAAKEID